MEKKILGAIIQCSWNKESVASYCIAESRAVEYSEVETKQEQKNKKQGKQ